MITHGANAVQFRPAAADTERVWQSKRPESWSEWYAFARETLEYEPHEAIAYANLRYVEDLNRAPNRIDLAEGVPAEPEV